eukprot:g6539.t1
MDPAVADEIDQEKERMAMLEKIKDASNGPEFVDRRIRQLDKMVFKLKSSRRLCQAQMDEDQEAISFIDREVADINVRYIPLCKALAKKKKKRDELKAQLAKLLGECDSMTKRTNKWVQKSRISRAKMQSIEASHVLASERGSPNTCFKLSISDSSRLYLAKKKREEKMKKLRRNRNGK